MAKLALCIVRSSHVEIDAFKPQEVERDLDVYTKEERGWKGRERELQMNFSRAGEHTSALDSVESAAYLLPAQRAEWPFVLEKMLRASQK